jgi:hypothetical protein
MWGPLTGPITYTTTYSCPFTNYYIVTLYTVNVPCRGRYTNDCIEVNMLTYVQATARCQLMKLTVKKSPIGLIEWATVVEKYCTVFTNQHRDVTFLHRKFNAVANTMPTYWCSWSSCLHQRAVEGQYRSRWTLVLWQNSSNFRGWIWSWWVRLCIRR